MNAAINPLHWRFLRYAQKMGASPSEDVIQLQFYLFLLSGFQCLVSMVFFSYYPLTRDFIFTYFASPTTYGVLTSERWSSLFWWLCSLQTLQILPLWLSGWMQVLYSRRSWKNFWLAWCFILLAWWLVTLGYLISYVATRNDPAYPNNPANSYRACCVPEFYNVVGACPNFGSSHPECDPGINLNELGTNGDMVFFFFFVVVDILIWILYIVVGWALIKPTALLLSQNDPTNPLMRFAKSSAGDGSTFIVAPPTAGTATNSKVSALSADPLHTTGASHRFSANGGGLGSPKQKA